MNELHIAADPELTEALFLWWEGDPPREGATVTCAHGEVALLADGATLLARLEPGAHSLTAKEMPALAPYFAPHFFRKPKPLRVCFAKTSPVPVDITSPLDFDHPEGPSYEASFLLKLVDARRFVAKLFAIESGSDDPEVQLEDDEDEQELDVWIVQQLYAATERALKLHGTRLDRKNSQLLEDVNQRVACVGLQATEIGSVIFRDGPAPESD